MNRVVIIVPFATPDEQAQVNARFRDPAKYGFWHWCAEAWLVSSTSEPLDHVEIRDWLAKLLPQKQNVVLSVGDADADKWALRGPNTWGEWFRATWESKVSASSGS